MSKKKKVIIALETLLSGYYCPILFAGLAYLITASPEFVCEFKNQLLRVLELHVENLEGYSQRAFYWAAIAKPLAQKEPLRVCQAAIKACTSHPNFFQLGINPHMFPLVSLLELLWDDPQARACLIKAAQTGQVGRQLQSWVKHKCQRRKLQ
ncbi:hypothetical protein [Methylacidiphilum kamchatkense]|uniref:Uncharacterized protein n=1 Tax=Methylacidiphilum kamchatkense Kam1 TaxID=1202785 RepID=A0A516TJR0_9BACT|nr:hypothetical protein [Methylacidiphilum kamchatkense]QDQ41490.1 hypothetical protein kam1_235 [Methylacidiphilum kamchatkense Kam1]